MFVGGGKMDKFTHMYLLKNDVQLKKKKCNKQPTKKRKKEKKKRKKDNCPNLLKEKSHDQKKEKNVTKKIM